MPPCNLQKEGLGEYFPCYTWFYHPTKYSPAICFPIHNAMNLWSIYLKEKLVAYLPLQENNVYAT
jgi:hypothetical protein